MKGWQEQMVVSLSHQGPQPWGGGGGECGQEVGKDRNREAQGGQYPQYSFLVLSSLLSHTSARQWP